MTFSVIITEQGDFEHLCGKVQFLSVYLFNCFATINLHFSTFWRKNMHETWKTKPPTLSFQLKHQKYMNKGSTLNENLKKLESIFI